MLLTELPARLDGKFSYPVELETVLDQMGSVQVEASDGTDTETIASILRPLGEDTFDSATILYETIYGNVSEDGIGRKYYDDRGGNVSGVDFGPTDEVNVSF